MEPAARILDYAKPSRVCTPSELRDVGALAVATAQVMEARAASFATSNLEAPLLYWYGSDCTPITLNTVHVEEGECGRVRRHARESAEFLIQRLFLLAPGRKVCCVVSDPIRMGSKTASAHMAAFLQLVVTPKRRGHNALMVGFHVWDRAVASAMEKLVKGYYEDMHAMHAEAHGAAAGHRSRLSTLLLFVGCIHHDAHNALRWGLRDFLSKQATRSVWVCCEALRKGYGELMEHRASWIISRVCFEDWAMPEDDIRAMWAVCGLTEEKWLEFAVDLRIRWHEGRLKVRRSAQDNNHLVREIGLFLLYVWRFRRFTESRWLSLGFSARGLLGSLLLGLDDLTAHIFAVPSVSHYYLTGFQFFGEDSRKLVLVTALSSRPSDEALSLLMRDDRVPLILPALEDKLARGVGFVECLSQELVDWIAPFGGFSGRALRNKIVAAAHAQAAYFMRRLRAAREPPFSLIHGDRLQNVQGLLVGERPTETNSAKLWEHMRRGGCTPDEALAIIDMIAEAGWSSKTVEEGHAASAVLMRYHSYTEATMRQRAFIVQVRPFFMLPQGKRKLLRLEHRAERAARRQHGRINGRHLYVRKLCCIAREKEWATGHVPHKVKTRIVKLHGKLWRGMAFTRRQQLHAEAARLRHDASEATARNLQQLRLAISRVRDALVEEALQAPILRLSRCRFGSEELRELAFAVKMTQDRGTCIDASSESRWCVRAEALPEPHQLFLERHAAAAAEAASAPTSAWASFVAVRRDDFKDCVFRVGGAEVNYYCFAYATVTPRFLSLAKLDVSMRGRLFPGPREYAHEPWDQWEHKFIYLGSYAFSDEADLQDDAVVVDVLPAVMRRGAELVVNGAWVAFNDYKAAIGGDSGHVDTNANETKDITKEARATQVFDECPWLMEYWAEKLMGDVNDVGDTTKQKTKVQDLWLDDTYP